MLDALVRRVRVVADRGADAPDLVRGDARADAGAADQDPAVDLAAAHGVPEALREVGIVVVRVGAVAAQVDHLVVRPRARHAPQQLRLQRRSRVIRREPDPHHEWPGSEAPVRSTPDSPLLE